MSGIMVGMGEKTKVDVLKLPDGRLAVVPCDQEPRVDGARRVSIVEPLQRGQPIPPNTSVGVISPRDDGHMDVEMVFRTGAGPAQVATDAFRDGWDQTFGGGESSDRPN